MQIWRRTRIQDMYIRILLKIAFKIQLKNISENLDIQICVRNCTKLFVVPNSYYANIMQICKRHPDYARDFSTYDLVTLP